MRAITTLIPVASLAALVFAVPAHADAGRHDLDHRIAQTVWPADLVALDTRSNPGCSTQLKSPPKIMARSGSILNSNIHWNWVSRSFRVLARYTHAI